MSTVVEIESSRPVERAEAAVTTGVAAAAMVGGGIGVFVIGLLTTGAAISEGLADALNWWNPSGPLSGKTGLGVTAWLVSWFILNRAWRHEDRRLTQAFTATLILIGLGLILTFPPVFEAFE